MGGEGRREGGRKSEGREVVLRELKCGSLHSQICRSKDADARIVPFGLSFVELISPCVSKCVHIIFQSDIHVQVLPKRTNTVTH